MRIAKTNILLTGLSGAGKSSAAKALEDLGFYCADNIPVPLIESFFQLASKSSDNIVGLCLIFDIRGKSFTQFESLNIPQLKKNFGVEILFLEATDEALIKRFNETRRQHPLSTPQTQTIYKTIQKERRLFSEIRANSDRIIDTSNLSIYDLKETLSLHYGLKKKHEPKINILSFGYKFGIPLDRDIIFDARILPNPFFIPSLQRYSGKDIKVKRYVFSKKETKIFLSTILNFILKNYPFYVKQERININIGVGCTGGRHRSVAIAERLGELLKNKKLKPIIDHRDIGKEQ